MQQHKRVIPSWLPYVAPLVLFLLITYCEQSFGVHAYPFVFAAKTVVLSVLLWSLRRFFPELKTNTTGVALGLLLGPILTALWVIIDKYTPHLSILGSRTAYDPFTSIPNEAYCWLFIIVRLVGLVAVAPIIEELFYRSFLLRFIARPDDFTKVDLGTFDWISFAAVVALMASAHPEYLAAAVFSATMNILLYRTKNLWATIAAHASTNLCLGIYVLYFHAWKYW
jgi:CAAX prenyl protease-like protein